MSRPISEVATDPLQYDTGEVVWSSEGSKSNHIRRMFLEKLTPYIQDIKGKRVIDIGCGQGWLCAEMTSKGALTFGIDPSANNIKAAKEEHSGLSFQQASLQDFVSNEPFDLATALMVLEHMSNAQEALAKIKSLLKPNGRLLLITGDFDKFTHPRYGYSVTTEQLTDGEVATRTDYGERAGVIYDINRTTDVYVQAAARAGFTLLSQEPITAPQWLADEQPKYADFREQPLFHLFEFAVNQPNSE